MAPFGGVVKPRPGQSGFSAIEALAALAIIAIALIPLAELQTQITRDHGQQRAAREQASAQASALALLGAINPMLAPAGSRSLDEGTMMRWRATPISPQIRSTRLGAGEGDFEVRLYRVTVSIEGRRSRSTFALDQLGWRPNSPAT